MLPRQPAVSFLERPPADIQVLLGLAKDEQHRKWIATQHLYNLRADRERRGAVNIHSAQLAVHYVLVYPHEKRRGLQDDEVGEDTPPTVALRANGGIDLIGSLEGRRTSREALALPEVSMELDAVANVDLLRAKSSLISARAVAPAATGCLAAHRGSRAR